MLTTTEGNSGSITFKNNTCNTTESNKRTAMQELKDDIIIEKKLGFITENSCNRILEYIDNLYFKKEKEQILEAFDAGFNEANSMYQNTFSLEYYNQTYNPNK
jgi:hypothetical protein